MENPTFDTGENKVPMDGGEAGEMPKDEVKKEKDDSEEKSDSSSSSSDSKAD